jgi:flagellar assembly factor FliW
MKVKSKAFGEIEISEKQKIYFKNGLLGFEDMHEFVLLDTEEGSPFYWLQSEKMTEVAFVLINPNVVIPDYELKYSKEDLTDLGTENETELLRFSIVTIYEKAQDITVNLLGPIVINKTTKIAKQIINQNDQYSVKHPLLQERGQ